ncbi:MAG: hypothetical protein HN742_07920 [Lentisphaerae bacterium]|jgi:hypothetical protein|nr:hypothetical protein [Lentisphaerota bacterium]MBT4817884.1 hypothetical protein [Lentisphaerota bacterium]MBT5604731.1 hypothetical protein [Lentisphaerota bacterium]MBT7058095.1 hypothetical protein [Lentisphaerota bacterium]MBT7841783.1 hypothetical protein [Lentisphaerota bacterium]
MTKQPTSLTQRLSRLVRQKHLFFAGQALTLIGLLAFILAGAVIAADVLFGLQAWVRWAAFFVLLTVSIGGLLRRFLFPSLHYHNPEAVREVEHRFEDMGQMLRTTAQIGDPETAREAGFSPGLVKALQDQAEERVAETDLAVLVPWGIVRRRATELALVLLVFVAALFLWKDFRRGAQRLLLPAAELPFTGVEATASTPTFERGDTVVLTARTSGRLTDCADLHIREEEGEWNIFRMDPLPGRQFSLPLGGRNASFEFYVSSGDGRTAISPVRFIDPPVVLTVTASLTYPVYTGLPAEDVEGEQVLAVEGTRARVTFKLNHGLATADARWQEQDVALEFGEDTVVCELEIVVGKHVLELTGEDDDDLPLAPFRFTITGLPDRLPKIEILEPTENPTVTKLTEVPALIRARDDFGLAELGLVLSVNGQESVLDARTFTEQDSMFASRLSHAILLERHALDFRSNVRLYAFARDHKPREGARAVSDLVAIDIRPFRILYRMKPPEEPSMSEAEMEEQADNIEELEKAITAQRRALSQTFRMREQQTTDPQSAEALARTEEALAEKVSEISEIAAPLTEPQNQSLLPEAAQAMLKAAEELREPDAAEAFTAEDTALANMLKMREELIHELREQQQNSPPKPSSKKQQKPKPQQPLDTLAAEAERLAREEEAIAQQLEDRPPEEENAQPPSRPPPQAPQQSEAAAERQQADAEATEQPQQSPEAQAAAQDEQAAAQQQPQQAAEQDEQAGAQQQTQQATEQDEQAAAQQQPQQAAEQETAQEQSPEAPPEGPETTEEQAATQPGQEQPETQMPEADSGEQPETQAEAEDADQPEETAAQETAQGEAESSSAAEQPAAEQQPEQAASSEGAPDEEQAQESSPQDTQSPAEQAVTEAAERQARAVAAANALQDQLDDHAETTELAMERMNEVAQAMNQAAEALAEARPEAAQPSLDDAAERLEQLAEHLRGLDQKNLADMLTQAQEKAEQAAQQLENPPEPSSAAAPPPEGEEQPQANAPASPQSPQQAQSQPEENEPQEAQPSQSQPQQAQPQEAQAAQGQPQQPQPQEAQAAQGQPQQGEPQESQPSQSQPPEQGQPQEAQAAQGQPQQSQPQESQPSQTPSQSPSQQQQAQQQDASNPSEEAEQRPTEDATAQREATAQDAETVADWLRQASEREADGLEAMQERLAEAREKLAVDELGDDIRQAQEQREQQQGAEASRMEASAAERFRELADTLAKEKQRLVQAHLERLAEAEAEATELKRTAEAEQQAAEAEAQAQSESQSESEAQAQAQSESQSESEAQAPSQSPSESQAKSEAQAEAQSQAEAKGESGKASPLKPDTTERLTELAEELKDLKDEELDELGDQLLEQVGAQNVSGGHRTAQVAPKDIAETTLEPTVERLRTLINEIVQKEFLLNRDDRVPDRYTRLVERYFKALSDDLAE